MYATSQRIRSGQGQDGINSFLHEHEGAAGADVDWDRVDAEQIAEINPGTAVRSCTDIPPGRNQVLSYLDVVCPDATSVTQIEAAITATKEALKTTPPPVERSLGPVKVRFGATIGLEGASEFECDALAERVIQIIRARSDER